MAEVDYAGGGTAALLFLRQGFFYFIFIYFLKSLSNFNSTPLHVFNSMMPIIPVYGSLQCY